MKKYYNMNSRNFWMLLFVYVVFVLYNGVDGVTDLAICGTPAEKINYSGAIAKLAVYNPTVREQQYSSARIKLQNGPDSIEAGWRVDPTLYGDHHTRLYIHTNTGQSHCFNTQCPGFVVTNASLPLDTIFPQISQRGGPIYTETISIAQDSTSGNWNLIIGKFNVQVGYWPKNIFSNSGLANYIEFGGEVFSLDSATKPRMGAGEFLKEDTNQDAFFSNVQIISESGRSIYLTYLKCSSDDKFYEIKDETNVGTDFGYLIFYGGPGTNE